MRCEEAEYNKGREEEEETKLSKGSPTTKVKRQEEGGRGAYECVGGWLKLCVIYSSARMQAFPSSCFLSSERKRGY